MVEFFGAKEVFASLNGWQVRWYGLLYVAALWLAWWLLPRLQTYRGLHLSREQWTYILTWAAVGVVVGGRLGYVLLYEPSFYVSNPAQIFALWGGGMSAHGGFIGVALAVWYASRKVRAGWLTVLDVAVVPAALGLALGRVGNLINGELFGGNPIAVIKNIVIAALAFFHLRRYPQAAPGQTTAIFLLAYGVLRFGSEYYREPEWPLTLGLTRGQLLTVPLFFIGAWLYFSRTRGKQ